MIGKIVIDNKNTTSMFSEAIIPNSASLSELVKMKVENPKAVVKLVRKVAFPIFWITRDSAFALFPCSIIS